MVKLKTPQELENLRASLQKQLKYSAKTISICYGSSCKASGAEEVITAIKNELEKNNLETNLERIIKETGCHGFCEQGPLVLIKPQNIFYCRVKPEDASRIVKKSIIKNEIIADLLFQDPQNENIFTTEEEIPFYKKQTRLLMQHNSDIDPRRLEDYLAQGGYSALNKVLTQNTPEEILEKVKSSGLRGRGGAGFPTGQKWESCRQAESEIKYLICNADEGDPGCFQDASLVEGNPHQVLEGMILGAYAVGITTGYIYIRYEYPVAVRNFREAIEQARDYGLLGENILDSGFSFDVQVKRGGGAFVCGESSALIASLEGRPGEPRDKYVRNTKKGLWGKPTLLNNVKTLASVPLIVEKGSDWFRQFGTSSSPGTMIFSLTGKIKHTGLVEIPMGISMHSLIWDIGGGIRNDKPLKAVQTGGPSGGCIPAANIDLPLDYEHLSNAGSMLGSGGMIVMDENTCMVDVARYFLSFTQQESCGKCVPCREGGKHLLHTLNKITRGEGQITDLTLIREISEAMQKGALCNLGRQAPNPVLTTLHYFENEYHRHIMDQKCPAGVCRHLISFYISTEDCTGCGKCMDVCPEEAIRGEKREPHHILQGECNRCGICQEVCPENAISKG